MLGAITEDAEKIILLTQYIKNSVFSATAPALLNHRDVANHVLHG